jgi:hypothetical protein
MLCYCLGGTVDYIPIGRMFTKPASPQTWPLFLWIQSTNFPFFFSSTTCFHVVCLLWYKAPSPPTPTRDTMQPFPMLLPEASA